MIDINTALNEEVHIIGYLRFSSFLKIEHAVDCEVVAEGKTVAAPVQKTTRALNTTMSRFRLVEIYSTNFLQTNISG